MEIKKFESFGNEPVRKNQTVQDRYKVHASVFQDAMTKLREIMEENFGSDENLDWSYIGSFAHINDELVNIIEGWDEDMANELRKRMEY